MGKIFDTRLAKSLNTVQAEKTNISYSQTHTETYFLTWHEAINLLNERNLSLISAREYTENLRKQKRDQWKSWLPRPSVFANLNSSLSQLGDLSISDLNASIIAPLTIPNPYSELAQAFEYSLSYLQSIDNYKLNYRREVVSLYRVFSNMERVQKEYDKKDMGDAYKISEGIALLRNQDSTSEQLESIQTQLVRILNLPGKKPMPLTHTKPVINYETKLNSLKLGENYGKIAMRLASYNIESSLLREKGVQFRRWPNLNLNIATPAIYDNQNSNLNPTDPKSVHLFTSLFKTYDYTGSEVTHIQTARQNTEHVKTNLRLQLDSELRDWKQLCNQYQKILIAKQLAKERINIIHNDTSSSSSISQLKLLREAMSSYRQLEASKEQLDLEIWTWDDNAWK